MQQTTQKGKHWRVRVPPVPLTALPLGASGTWERVRTRRQSADALANRNRRARAAASPRSTLIRIIASKSVQLHRPRLNCKFAFELAKVHNEVAHVFITAAATTAASSELVSFEGIALKFAHRVILSIRDFSALISLRKIF